MKYLVDTNVFFHTINSNIYGVASLCKETCSDICISQTILNELEPGYYREYENISTKEIYTCVSNLVAGTWGHKAIRLIKLEDIEGAKEELKRIRDRFYGWMKDPNYLQTLIDDNKLTREDIKKPNFRKKDLGECELIAIVKVSKKEFWLVTNDQGRVFAHPDINIFETYANDADITIISGSEWIEKIGFIEE